jgi:hypothetical protein
VLFHDRYNDIARCRKGLATFGTPHRGSKYANLATTVNDVLGYLIDMSNWALELPQRNKKPNYVHLLTKDGEYLILLDTLFNRYYTREIFITSFWEMEKLNGITVSAHVLKSLQAANMLLGCREMFCYTP